MDKALYDTSVVLSSFGRQTLGARLMIPGLNLLCRIVKMVNRHLSRVGTTTKYTSILKSGPVLHTSYHLVNHNSLDQLLNLFVIGNASFEIVLEMFSNKNAIVTEEMAVEQLN